MGVCGILALQGGFRAHAAVLQSLGRDTLLVKSAEELERCERLVLPGGESTAMIRLLGRSSLRDALVRRVREGMPVFGTCAGMVLLSAGVCGHDMHTLGLLDCRVKRNAYGRQIASFEASLSWEGRSFPGVFIRAPRVGELGDGCRVLISFEGDPVLVRQENILAASFHPELSGDSALHRYFLEIRASGSPVR